MQSNVLFKKNYESLLEFIDLSALTRTEFRI